MKKLMFITAFVLAALTLSAQGSYLTRTIEVGINNLEQPPFAALAFSDSTKTQALTEDTWSVISEFIEISSNDVTTSDDTITIQKSGGYAVDASLGFYSTATDTLEVQLFKNATAFGPKAMSTAGVIWNTLSISTYVTLLQGDILTLKMQNTGSSDDSVLKSGSLFVRRIYK